MKIFNARKQDGGMLYKKILAVFIGSLCCNLIHPNEFFCLVSIPKSGTFLVTKALKLITCKNGGIGGDINGQLQALNPLIEFRSSHEPPSKEAFDYCKKNNIKVIFIYRDPRDQIVSAAHYLLQNPSHQEISDFITELIVNSCGVWSDKSGIFNNLQPKPQGNILEFYKLMMEWKNCPNIYVTTFEKLVGERGGGTDLEQVQEVMNIATFLKIDLDISQAQSIAEQLYGNTITFREGRIGNWKKYFTQDQKNLFKSIGAQLLTDLGYEHDSLW